MGILKDIFGIGGSRKTIKGKSRNNGGSYTDVRKGGDTSKSSGVGYTTYNKSTGKGKGTKSVKEHYRPKRS